MKKLLTFAGVSALALITAAPDAFAATGIFNPNCNPNEVTITFYGMAAPTSGSSTTPTLATLGTAKYIGGRWYNPDNLERSVTTFADLGITIPDITKSITADGIDATNGAKPFRADLAGIAPTEVVSGTLIGKSICESSAPQYSMGVLSDSTLPTSLGDVGNITELSYVVMYAANCANEVNAECSLNITADKRATYTNTCEEGYGGNSTNWQEVMCANDAILPDMPEDPGAPEIK